MFDVVAKVCTVSTNFLSLFKAGNARLALALATRVLGWDCDAGEGRIYNGSGLFLGWVVALGSKFMGIG